MTACPPRPRSPAVRGAAVRAAMLSRRTLVGGLGLAGAAMLVRPGGLAAQAASRIRLRPAARVVVDNDFAGDPDGLIALAHQLLSPKTQVTLITCSALDPKLAGAGRAGRTAAEAQAAVRDMMGVMRLAQPPRVEVGAERFEPAPSAAARALVAEAMRDDPLPLYVTCGGPLTNIAAALRMESAIARRMTVVWIGGGAYPHGGPEYNLAVDPDAARHVIEATAVPLWQVPAAAFRQLQYATSEFEAEFRPISPLTRWLYDRYTRLPAWVELGGALTMGDTPTVLLTAVSADSSRSRDVPARRIEANLGYGTELPGRTVRIFDQLDARLALADMLATFRLHAKRQS